MWMGFITELQSHCQKYKDFFYKFANLKSTYQVISLKGLESFISLGSKEGFIYFSMGSAVQGSQMSDAKRKVFLNVFSKLQQQVIWKWETETMPALPKNVKLVNGYLNKIFWVIRI